jgi:uncharacterized protein
MRNLNVVIDTNVLLVIIPAKSPYHWLFQAIKQNKLILLVSHEIVLEYEEQLKLRYDLNFSDRLLDIFSLNKNIKIINPGYSWRLISADPDDNKFADCAIAGNADMIITNDRDFDILKKISFPKINIITLGEFEKLFRETMETD